MKQPHDNQPAKRRTTFDALLIDSFAVDSRLLMDPQSRRPIGSARIEFWTDSYTGAINHITLINCSRNG